MIDVFKSEGSGRISGLSWSTGLVELSEEAMEINKGDMNHFFLFKIINHVFNFLNSYNNN